MNLWSVACNSSSSGQTAPNDDNAKQIELTLSKQILTIASPFLAATHCFAVQHRSRALYFGARRTDRGARHETTWNEAFAAPHLPLRHLHVCSWHGIAIVVAFPEGNGVDPRGVLQRGATAGKENIVVLCRGAHSNNHIFREQVIETVDAPVRHLLAVDGHPPTAAQMKEENDRHQALRNNASRRHAIQKQQGDDDKTMEELLRITPEAFVFEDQGKEGQSERIAFHPNPGFKPKTYEQRILHALDGIVFVDLHDKRIARLSGSLATGVEFGYGVIGHVQQGGTTEITRVHLSEGIWKTSAEKIDINGRFVLLKSINKHQDESRTGFEPVAPDTTFAQALNEIEKR